MIIDKLWDEYLQANVKPGTSPEELKAIASIFHWGAYLMFREIIEINKICWKEINNDFKEFDKETNNGNVQGG